MSLLHPAVRAWFEQRFPDGPTPAQEQGWPHVAARESTLIAAPTGSGKTLAGFLIAIDELYLAAARGEPVEGTTQVVYVSPLKALAVDVHQNLEVPLREIAEVAASMGMAAPGLRVDVRTGDTPPSARAAMLRRPPNFLVTTPESLYLLVTAQRSREALRAVRTVIVDEIHAVARDKRGSHLALTLERLESLCAEPPVRVGLSATQRPIETIARLLVGCGDGREDAQGHPRCAVVDVGHQRPVNLAIELPDDELGAVASREQLDEIVGRIAAQVMAHRTTLVFVNTRRMSERIAHMLGARLGDGLVMAHHGSLSRERRTLVEARLRAGELRALVATASLELGIDIGPIDLVCQISTPRSLATFLQRVGRSGHRRGATPEGRLFPMTRDDLVECCALLAGLRAGRLDAVDPPVAPLDILAQQLIAECAAREGLTGSAGRPERRQTPREGGYAETASAGIGEDDLYRLVRRAAPYAALRREDFNEVVELVSSGVATGRGPRGAYLHRDRVHHRLRARRGARLAALTSGGAIPETGDYRVLAEPDEAVVGSVNEDWAIESMAGDVFLLGSTSWRITRVTGGTVRVVDARGASPSVPFWLGEAPGRTRELSEEVSALRAQVDSALAGGDRSGAVLGVAARCGVTAEVAAQVVDYLAAARTALGVLPTREHIVVERFFDESGGTQVVVHAPFGARLNRGLGLALRKRFCATFDFELQAAASDDAVLLSLGPQHSLPLEDVPRFLSSRSVEEVLRRAVIFSPMFPVRWRWALNRSLVVLRFKGGRRNPAPIQRMESDDVMAAVFPALTACQNENPTGPAEPPDHPLVRQTMHDCLREAMDVDALRTLVGEIEAGTVRVTCRDTTEPSVLAHEIVSGHPHTFLDDAPLEERRSRAVSLRRGLPVDPRELAALDPDAIARVREEAAAAPGDAEELHDLLLSLVVVRPRPEWAGWWDQLVGLDRAQTVSLAGARLWSAVESRGLVEAMLPTAAFDPDRAAPAGCAAPGDPAEAAALTLRGHLEAGGPTTAGALAAATGLPAGLIATALARLEAEGLAVRGAFDPSLQGEQWCSRRLLMRVHSYTRERLRREVVAVTPRDLMRFLLRWHGVAAGTLREGRAGVANAIAQLQGVEAPAGAWEGEILPRRVAGYRTAWLDDLCLSGSVAWGRLRVRDDDGEAGARGRPFPSRSTPVTLVGRGDLPWLLQAVRGTARPSEPERGAARDVIAVLREHGALFTDDITALSRRLPSEVKAGLWDGVARGMVTADGFAAVRSLLHDHRHGGGRRSHGLRRGVAGSAGGGRWSLVPQAAPVEDHDALAEAVAEQLLARWGVVFRDLLARETLAVPWREVLWALRRMEARGTARGGLFVAGFSGEQYALPEAVDLLRSVRRGELTGELVTLSAADPLNLMGIVVPGPRVPALHTNRVAFRDGMPEVPAAHPESPAEVRLRAAV
ncbi:MAG: DEAD/DEAH box helicase [Candidatus Dormibacteria bacterium]